MGPSNRDHRLAIALRILDNTVEKFFTDESFMNIDSSHAYVREY